METLKKAIIFLLEKHLESLQLKRESYISTMDAFPEEQAIKEAMESASQQLRQEIIQTEEFLEAVENLSFSA